MSKTLKKGEKGFESPRDIRPFRLNHQILCVTGVNFQRKSIIGYVELHVLPLIPDLNRIKLNSKQCRIYRVCINEIWEASFLYNDPTLAICQTDAKQRNINFFLSCQTTAVSSVDADYGNGELTIRIPQEAMHLVHEMKLLRISIEFSLEMPQGGMHFVLPDVEGVSMAEKAAHMFTYGHENSSRLWFPCVDSYSEPCTWKLEFTVDSSMTAVSCGDLIETIFTPDMKKKTFHYVLNIPTAAPNIALAVGPFEILVDPHMHEVTHFCLPHLLPLLKHSTKSIHQAFEFFEEHLGTRYPYTSYKQVFVDEAYVQTAPYATMTIFSTNILHPPLIIDQTFDTRKLMAWAVAEQFFGCFMAAESWDDSCLIKGISDYLLGLYIKKTFGNNEYRYYISELLAKVCTYEKEVNGLILHGASSSHSRRHPHAMSCQQMKMARIKAHFVIRLIEIRIGQDLLIQGVFNKLLSLASAAALSKAPSKQWANLLLSTNTFVKLISTVSGKDLTNFMERWVEQGGCVRLNGSFVFNRKRNIIELEIKQDITSDGTFKYTGPLQLVLQELDGSFKHTVQIEGIVSKHEITCHSKSRRHKKKKIPLGNGEEVDMDLNSMDADSPVLWLRIDPQMNLIRHVIIEQPDYMWQYQVRHERDIIGQMEALEALENFPSPATRMALTETIENDQCFYRVRKRATYSLAKVANAMVGSWSGPPAMTALFQKMYGSPTCQDIVRQNNFSNLKNYFLQKTIPVAISKIRNAHLICPKEVLDFLRDLIKYNDNRKNKFSDNYYRASLINALAGTITPAVTAFAATTEETLSPETRLILEEVTRYLNMEKLLPCYHHTVTVSCLRAIHILQKNGHLPMDSSLFRSYAEYGNFVDIRLTALECLVNFVKENELSLLLDMVENDPVPYIRHCILRMLSENPPFKPKDEVSLNNEILVERLWAFMNSKTSHDTRLRCDTVDLYCTLWGKNRPSCLSIPELGMVLNLKEKKAVVSSSIVAEELASNVESPNESIDKMVENEGESGEENIQAKNNSNKLKRKADSPLLIEESGSGENQLKLKITISGSSAEDKEINKTGEDNKLTHSGMNSEEKQETINISGGSVSGLEEGELEERPVSPCEVKQAESPSHALSSAGPTPTGSIQHHHDSATTELLHSKPHKAKKKKKKNKHKHKHKHSKHERQESGNS